MMRYKALSQVGGLGEAGEDNGRWGAVTKFSLLYKDPKTDQWLYYSDSEGIPRVPHCFVFDPYG